jgi:hypothetical protein
LCGLSVSATTLGSARVAQLAEAAERERGHVEPVRHALLELRLRCRRERGERGEGRGVAVPRERRGGAHANIGPVALERLRQLPLRVVVHERVDGQQANVAVGVVNRLQQHLLRGLRVLLDERLDREFARVGVLRAEGRVENRDLLVLLGRELERLAPQPGIGVVEELVQQRRGPLFLLLSRHFGQRFAAHVGVNGLQREAERGRAAAGDLEVQRGLERFRAHAPRAVVERADEQVPTGFARSFGRLLLDHLDERFEAAPPHVLVGRGQPGFGHAQRGLVEDFGECGVRRVAHRRLRIEQQRAQAVHGALVVEGRERAAHVHARGHVLFAAQLKQQAERARVAQHREAACAAQAGVERAARGRLEQRVVVARRQLVLGVGRDRRRGLVRLFGLLQFVELAVQFAVAGAQHTRELLLREHGQ